MKILKISSELKFSDFSKNAQHGYAKGMVYNKNSVFMKRLIEEIDIESKIAKIRWQNEQTWLLIKCHKKNQCGDTINVLDVLADCVKKGIGIDDHFFSAIIDYKVGATVKPKVEFWILQNVELTELQSIICEFLEGVLI